MSHSQRLRECMDELKNIIQEYDVGAVITLHDGQGMSEFALFIDTPSWSNFRFIKDGKGHFKAHMKSDPVNTSKTVNMLAHAQDLTGRNFMVLDQLMKQIEQILEVERTKPLTFPRKDAPIKQEND